MKNYFQLQSGLRTPKNQILVFRVLFLELGNREIKFKKRKVIKKTVKKEIKQIYTTQTSQIQ